MLNYEQIGKRIAFLRQKQGFSQSAFAQKLNVSAQAVSKWECAQTLPDIERLLELSWLFGMSVNALLESTDKIAEYKENNTLPQDITTLPLTDIDKTILQLVTPYFSTAELCELAQVMSCGTLELDVTVTAKVAGKKSTLCIPYSKLSPFALGELVAELSEVLSVAVGSVARGLRRIIPFMCCPDCKTGLALVFDDNSKPCLKCETNHIYAITDGVVDFGTREILGEQWSLTYRNYEHYLIEATWPDDPAYTRGDIYSEELKWREIEKRRPRILLDVACGTGSGIKYIIERINWNCTVILADISHRILAWDRQFIAENKSNPYVEMAYISCDCAIMPFFEQTVDCVCSRGGFESMQDKMIQGFCEAYRILKDDGYAVYDKSIIEGHESENSQKWLELLKAVYAEDDHYYNKGNWELDINQWLQICKETGYAQTDSIKVYGEMPAPDTDIFPWENMLMRWMEEYICISKKCL